LRSNKDKKAFIDINVPKAFVNYKPYASDFGIAQHLARSSDYTSRTKPSANK